MTYLYVADIEQSFLLDSPQEHSPSAGRLRRCFHTASRPCCYWSTVCHGWIRRVFYHPVDGDVIPLQPPMIAPRPSSVRPVIIQKTVMFRSHLSGNNGTRTLRLAMEARAVLWQSIVGDHIGCPSAESLGFGQRCRVCTRRSLCNRSLFMPRSPVTLRHYSTRWG